MSLGRFSGAVAIFLTALAVGSPAAAAAGQSASAPSAQASIIGGRAAPIVEFPWLAFFQGENFEGAFTCTGAVVAPRVVLTAGHCIEEPNQFAPGPPSSFAVTTGVADWTKAQASNLSSVSRAVFFPNFETAKPQIDAGLLILSAPVSVPALQIATAADPEPRKPGTPISIAGWGLAKPSAKSIPKQLQAAALTVLPTDYCRRHTAHAGYGFPAFTPASQLCALNPQRAMGGCFGDSGGPAIAQKADGTPVEIGIVVSGGPECSRKLPNIYTRVDRVSAWISGWIASVEHGAPAPPTPKAAPPYLSIGEAREIVVAELAQVFRDRFRSGTGKRSDCRRVAWPRVRCGVAWRHGKDRYHGSVTAFLAVGRGLAVRPRARYDVQKN
jgi:secreted trypsin-like serine protease